MSFPRGWQGFDYRVTIGSTKFTFIRPCQNLTDWGFSLSDSCRLLVTIVIEKITLLMNCPHRGVSRNRVDQCPCVLNMSTGHPQIRLSLKPSTPYFKLLYDGPSEHHTFGTQDVCSRKTKTIQKCRFIFSLLQRFFVFFYDLLFV